MSGLIEGLLSLHGWLALALICLLPGLEAPAFLGLILPGELALVLGGVLAHEGRVSLPAAIAAGAVGAVAGDSLGYWLGHRWRHLLLATPIGRRVRPAQLRRAESILNRRGGLALFVGRLTAGARVLLPGLAGASRMRYRIFLLWNAPAGVAWATAHVMLGYATGEGWRRIHHLAGRAAVFFLLGVALLALLGLVTHLLSRRRRQRSKPAADASSSMSPPPCPPTGPGEDTERPAA
jgi:membrane-associated protein